MKQQDDSESDQSEKSKVTSSSPTSVAGRRDSSSSRTVDGKDAKKVEKVDVETKNDDVEEINYKEMLNRLDFFVFAVQMTALTLNLVN